MPKPMKDDVVEALRSRAGTFGWRMMQLQPFDVTHQQFLDLVCPKHHHQLLWEAAAVANIATSEDDIPLVIPRTIDGIHNPKFDFKMRTHEGNEPPLRPRDPTWRSCDPIVQEKVVAWVEHYLVTTRMTSTVRWLVEYLTEICDTGYQMRYLWPAILHLCAGTAKSEVHAWVDKFGVRTVPRNLPSLSPAFRKLLGETSEWCAKAVLLEEIQAAQYGQVFPSRNCGYEFTLSLDEHKIVLSRSSL